MRATSQALLRPGVIEGTSELWLIFAALRAAETQNTIQRWWIGGVGGVGGGGTGRGRLGPAGHRAIRFGLSAGGGTSPKGLRAGDKARHVRYLEVEKMKQNEKKRAGATAAKHTVEDRVLL